MKISIKSLLSREDIKPNLKGNFFMSDEDIALILDKVNQSQKDNALCIDINSSKLEVTLHIDSNKQLYLLECRLFEINGQMINAYLQVIDFEGNIVREDIDDVWEYANWKVV